MAIDYALAWGKVCLLLAVILISGWEGAHQQSQSSHIKWVNLRACLDVPIQSLLKSTICDVRGRLST